MKERKGSCRPTMAESFIRFRPVTPASATMGIPKPPNATGVVLAIRARVTALRGVKAQAEQQKSRHRHGRAEAGRAFQQGAKTERHQDGLHARVAGGVFAHPSAQQIKIADVDGEVVDPQRRKNDPEDGPDRVGHPDTIHS